MGPATALPVIGFLSGGSREPVAFLMPHFRQGLREAGYIEGQNVAIEYQSAEGHYDRLPALAADLVRRQVAVIATNDAPAALAAKAATSTVPIIFETGFDPVDLRLVASLNRPSGNITGVTRLNAELGAKRLELLHELVPQAITIAVLTNPTNANVTESATKGLRVAARVRGLQLHLLSASTENDIDSAFATLAQLRASALVIAPDAFFFSRRNQLVARAARHGVATIHPWREAAAAGGLMSYGNSYTDSFRQFGAYTGRILKGEKPTDLPVLQPTKFELVINLKTAKALGLTLPLTLQAAAAEVIE